MKKFILTILLVLIFSLNLLSQIDFSVYPEIPLAELENYEYTIVNTYDEHKIILVQIEGIIYVVFY